MWEVHNKVSLLFASYIKFVVFLFLFSFVELDVLKRNVHLTAKTIKHGCVLLSVTPTYTSEPPFYVTTMAPLSDRIVAYV